VNEFFSIHLIVPAAIGSGVYSAFERNEYQSVQMMFLRSRAWPVRRAYLTVIVSRLSRQCGILNISQPYGSPRPVTGIDLIYSSTRMPVEMS
jgi:hypothetical protein